MGDILADTKTNDVATGSWEADARAQPVGGKAAPAYFQIAEFFRARIARRVLKPGEQTPTENEIMEAFGVSRHTARNAIQTLVVDGLLAKFPGRGTFVVDKSAEEPIWAIGSFASFMSQSYPGEPKIIDIKWVKTKKFTHALSHHAKWLGKPFLRVTLIRRQQSEIFSYAIIDIPELVALKIRSEIDNSLPSLPIMKAIEEVAGIKIDKIRQTLTVVSLEHAIAEQLNVTTGSSALKLVNAFFDGNADPVELSQIFFPPDVYEHNFEISRGDVR